MIGRHVHPPTHLYQDLVGGRDAHLALVRERAFGVRYLLDLRVKFRCLIRSQISSDRVEHTTNE